MKKRTLAWLVLLPLLAVGGYYGYKYFLDPEGISLAEAEFCIINGTEEELVFVGKTEPGATMVMLLSGGDGDCVPAPVANPKASVAVGPSETDLVCNFEKDSETENLSLAVRLESYNADGNCVWGE